MTHTTHGLRLARKGAGMFMAVGVAVAAIGLFGHTTVARADLTNQGAEGDAAGVTAVVQLVGQPPVEVGPIAPTLSSQPGGPPVGSADVANCPNCVPPLLTSTGAINTRSAATLTSATNNCTTAAGFPVAPSYFTGGLTGGSACASVAGAQLINSGITPVLTAGVIQSQSVTQSCTATPFGNADVINLNVLGVAISSTTVPQLLNLGPNTNLGNLLPALGAAGTALNLLLQQLGITIILNEQHYDNVGHGLTVNGVHVILANPIGTLAAGDVVIAHSHSEALCAGVVTPPPPNVCSPPGSGCTPPDVPVITKNDSTHTAAPGDTLTYTISVAQHVPPCGPIVQVIDTLPPFFTVVSTSGPLGNPTLGTSGGRQTLTWRNLAGYTGLADPIVETVNVAIGAAAQGNVTYFNDVATTSSICGTVSGTDGGVAVNAAAVATPTAATLPNTAAVSAPGGGSATGTALVVLGGIVFMGGVAVLARRRRTT